MINLQCTQSVYYCRRFIFYIVTWLNDNSHKRKKDKHMPKVHEMTSFKFDELQRKFSVFIAIKTLNLTISYHHDRNMKSPPSRNC